MNKTAAPAFRTPSRRTERTVHNGTSAWIKYACHSKITFWHRCQKIVARVIPMPLLRPTASGGGTAAIADEINRLRGFRQQGFLVPDVLLQGEDHVILADIGATLKDYLDKEPSEDNRLSALTHAAKTLAAAHNQGLVHGRPHVKDMVYNPATSQVGFLDFEENPLSVMPLPTAQERDLWLFLCSCGRYIRDNDSDIRGVADAYLAVRGGITTLPKPLISLAYLLKPLRILVEKCLMNHVGHDVRNVVIVNKLLENHTKPLSLR